MKTIRNIVLISLAMIYIIVGCDNLSYVPTDQLSDEVVLNSKELLGNITIGNYGSLRSANYNKLRQDCFEFGSDDGLIARTTSNHLLYQYNYNHINNSNHSRDFWTHAYHTLYSINTVLEAIPDGSSADLLQLKGENLFLRALLHFDLVRIFGRPYSHDSPETNLGVVIMNSSDIGDTPSRSTVKETYEFIVQDLLKAADYMTVDKGNIYASKVAAWALLARAYLYMEQNAKAIEFADKVISSGRHQLVSTANLANYATFVPENNTETIFAVKFLASENLGINSCGSFHHGVGGWGQIFASKPFRVLISKYPEDKRINFIDPDWVLDAQGKRIPDPTEDIFPGDTIGYKMTKREGKSKYWTCKMTYEQGVPMLHSPVIVRLAEMYLIKAEAAAKTGDNTTAISYVNIIRQRAGLSGAALYSTTDLKWNATVLDVVLEERRLELCFEGHRFADVFRNKRDMNRSYIVPAAWSGDPYIPYTSLKIVNLIPLTEMILNPNLEQNPLPTNP
jgi:hypothetical protein